MLTKIFFSGAVVNFFAVIIGSLIGFLLHNGIPERIRNNLMNGMALCVLYIGITGLFEKGVKMLIVILSLTVGAVLGEWLDLDRHIGNLGERLERAFNRKSGDSKISDGFISTTMLFCVGAMAVVGSIDSGIAGDNLTLYSKSLMDGISAAAFASSLGIGVIFSALSVLVYEGALTLLATLIAPAISTAVAAHISVVGSLLILGLGLNMLGITKLKLMNCLPAIFLPIALCYIL